MLANLLLTTTLLQAQAGDLHITNVKLIDVEKQTTIQSATVTIRGNKIFKISKDSKGVPMTDSVIDGKGKFLIPGLSDMHHHLIEGGIGFAMPNPKKTLTNLLAAGVTSIYVMHTDMATFKTLRETTKNEQDPYPRAYSTGRLITAKNGWGAWMMGYQCDTPEEAVKAVGEMKTAGVDAIKVVYDDMGWITKSPMPVMKPEVLKATIAEAHKNGLRVLVHAPVLKYAKEALRAGADGLVHGIISDPIDAEFISLMKKNKAFYVGTHSLYESSADVRGWAKRLEIADTFGLIKKDTYTQLESEATEKQMGTFWTNIPLVKQKLPILRANLKKASDAGLVIATGTDTGVPGVLNGISSSMELALHVEAGLTPMQALRAATIGAAKMAGVSDRLGSISAGKVADMVLLDADPLKDIANVRKVMTVFKAGKPYSPRELVK